MPTDKFSRGALTQLILSDCGFDLASYVRVRLSMFWRFYNVRLRHSLRLCRALVDTYNPNSGIAIDDLRLLTVGIEELLDLLPALGRLPMLELNGKSGSTPWMVTLAQEYVEAKPVLSCSAWLDFLSMSQSQRPFTYRELLLSSCSLRFAAIVKVFSTCITGQLAMNTVIAKWAAELLRTTDTRDTEELFEGLLSFERYLQNDPAQIYQRLDSRSKHLYRRAVYTQANAMRIPVDLLGKTLVEMCSTACVAPVLSNRLYSHLGFYLLDKRGIAQLRAKFASRAHEQMSPFLWIILFATVSVGLTWLVEKTFAPVNSTSDQLFLIAMALILVSWSVGRILAITYRFFTAAKGLPSLDFQGALPLEYKSVVAVPCVLSDLEYVLTVCERLLQHYRTVNDQNVCFVLLADFVDCETPESRTALDEELLKACCIGIDTLNRRPEVSSIRPFMVMHRQRVYSSSQGLWVSWERKRGKIVDFFSLIIGRPSRLSCLAGDSTKLRGTSFVLVLDDHNSLATSSLHTLVGTMVHPLNHPHFDSTRRHISRGYGILQPLVLPSGFKPPHSCVPLKRDIYQEIFEESGFYGKGLFNVNCAEALMSGPMPEDLILSHDIVESTLIPTAAANHAILFEGFAQSHDLACRRRHRWIRGDWQNLWWLAGAAVHRQARMTMVGPIVIVRNVRDSLLPIAIVSLILLGAVRTPWSLVPVLVALAAPEYLTLALSLCAARRLEPRVRWLRWFCALVRWPSLCIQSVGPLLHDGLTGLDAVATALYRLVLKTRLLEWESSSAAERSVAPSRRCRLYSWVGVGTCTLGLVLVVRTDRLFTIIIGGGLLAWWAIYPFMRSKDVSGLRCMPDDSSTH